jgi:hypothetical protein
MTELNEPARAKVYRNAQGIEVEQESEQKKWALRLGFYAVYYTFIYLLYLFSISIITGYTHSAGQKSPVSQARLGTPRMTMFPLDQIREIDWAPRSGVDNHLWYKSNVYDGKTMAAVFKEKLEQRLTNMNDQNFTTNVDTFCAGDYKDFKNGKACFLVGVNTIVNWQPVKLVPDSKHSWFNAKLSSDAEKTSFTLASQGLTDNADADILFGCRVFDTNYDAANSISRPKQATHGIVMTNGIDWMHNENYLKSYTPFLGGVNPKTDESAPTTDIYKECVQPSYYSAKCNINTYDYKTWTKPFTAVRIDMSAIHTEFQATQASSEVQHGYEFKCNAYAQNIVTPMYDSASKLYFEGENGSPIVQSGGKELHQNFIIQHEE